MQIFASQGHTRGWEGMRSHKLHLLGGATCKSSDEKSLGQHFPLVFTREGLKQHLRKLNKSGLVWAVTAGGAREGAGEGAGTVSG